MIKFIASVILVSIVISSPVSAVPERYPTNSEIKTLRQKFRQQITKMKSDKVGSGYIRDRRSSPERQARNSFVKSWNKVDPSIASFLGSWGGYEDTYHIYPAKKRQKVCIIGTGEGHGRFTTGTISNGNILTEDRVVLFREGIHLGSGKIYNGKPQIMTDIPYNSPTLPKSVAEITSSSLPGEESEKNSIRQGFKENNCISPAPNNGKPLGED
jgi:hypothetical protein